MKKMGYIITVSQASSFYADGVSHVEKDDTCSIYDSDAEATAAAEKRGYKFIRGMAGVMDGVYLDTQQNRNLLTKMLRERERKYTSLPRKASIVETDKRIHYFDKNGYELYPDDIIIWDSGKEEKVYLSCEGELGIDATNPAQIECGYAFPCEHGLYPLTEYDLSEISKKF